MQPIQVLLIEDDPMVRQVNRQFIEQVPGYSLIGTAKNGMEGIQQIKQLKPDLVFMDIFMPEQDGIETLKKIREKGLKVDVIAVTAANDMKTIQKMLQLGVFDYIMKPFSFERMKHTLQNYRQYKNKMEEKSEMTQKELDALLHHQLKPHQPDIKLPKGLNASTLEKIVSFIGTQEQSVSAEEVANGVGLARVTARRYLDYLEKQNKVKIDIQYGGVGRPVNQYRLIQ
ncbi:response regulator [Rummeliibacillus suwonensis]|uniref:response regulator n=1 Tax=Rummeliibacillus suwonensis TaxID=1306154 RepID=UPI0011B6D9FC|nr:response regulator [Rummeliibacillus suwonensis]MBO2536643.1 response regulator [Rummeliibacillus suwonensis]